jgi:formylglycine-generating enzyme required for sulfatase activity
MTGSADRIVERLRQRFGAAAILQDLGPAPLGADLRAVAAGALSQCAAAVVIIGPAWISGSDAEGQRWLDSPTNEARLALEAALRRGIPVAPVLVGGAHMPAPSNLPSGLADLAYRQGIEVHADERFDADMTLLIERLTAALASPSAGADTRWPDSETPSSPPQHTLNWPPERLTTLGFVGKASGGMEYLEPPLCDVPAGDFLMGNSSKHPLDSSPDERPQHKVQLRAYRIGAYPVTVAEYTCFVRSGYPPPDYWQALLEQGLDHPMSHLSWEDATAYAAWLAQVSGALWRLPTEAEWEKAARWDAKRKVARRYPWGDQFDPSKANTDEGKRGTTTAIGSYPNGASPCGALDMAGNVEEWTASWYRPYPYRPDDGRENRSGAGERVLRGGSWFSAAHVARCAFRGRYRPAESLRGSGFRLACDLGGDSANGVR